MQNHKRDIYFKNLDGLRFVAALFVIIGHCQSWIWDEAQIEVYFPYVNKLASFGVDFFFVLSGFLIGFMLLEEIETTGTIHIRRFYVRRILRLWPLYFLVGTLSILFGSWLLAFFDAPYPPQSWRDFGRNFLFLYTFSTNIQTMLSLANPVSSLFFGHFWSLSVEEQFYLMFAPLVRWMKNRVWVLLHIFIIGGFILNAFFPFIVNEMLKMNLSEAELAYYTYNFTFNRFYFFGLGAMCAWLLRHGLLTPQYPLGAGLSKVLQWSFVVPACVYLFGKTFYHFQEPLVNGLLSFVLICLAIDKHSILNLEYRWLKYLGKISFGIYIFHLISVRISAKILLEMDVAIGDWRFWVAFPALATVFSVGFGVLSFEYFEKYFLAMKNKFK